MAIKIKFDNAHNPITPTIVLANRNGHKLGVLPAVNINIKGTMDVADDLQFRVYKSDNGVIHHLWSQVKDFKLVWCPEWDAWFDISVDLSDSESGIYKTVTATSLGESELAQINLYGVEINTEDDIDRDDYEETIIYDADNPRASLLDRILEKAPHYTIGHVDESIAELQRTFSFDKKSILDSLREITEEVDGLLVIDDGSDDDGKPTRKICIYDMQSVCQSCGYRGAFDDSCPECGSADIVRGYGEYTSIFVSRDNLADEIDYSTNADSVKNCYKLEGGDDFMTATIRNCNPNGSSYIWFIPDEQREDMSVALSTRLAEYDVLYNQYSKEYAFVPPASIVSQYNALVSKYSRYNEDLESIPYSIIGYSNIMLAYYNTIDLEIYLRSELMPTPSMSDTTAELEAAKLTSEALSPTAVSNLATCSDSTASSAVLSTAKMIVAPGYQVKVDEGSLDGQIWIGNFTITNYSDDEDTATSEIVEVDISDDFEDYISQRLNVAISKASDNASDISSLFKMELSAFKEEIKRYGLSSLNSMHDICQSCVDILIQQGVANSRTWAGKDPNLYTLIYVPYYNKLGALAAEIKLRESELEIVTGKVDSKGGLLKDGMQTVLDKERKRIHGILDFEKYLGSELALEFATYRREDLYNDENCISDGLKNSEVFESAFEFLEKARSEIYKAAMQQHTLSASLHNLLVMKEFLPIVDSFEVGNWMTLKVDDTLIRLRLTSYEIDFDALDEISVEYSDVARMRYNKNTAVGIMHAASQMAMSYDAVKRQAKLGRNAGTRLNSIMNGGIALG